MISKRFSLILITILFAGTVSLFASSPTDSLKIKTTVDTISSGKQLYSTSCIRCHQLSEPSKYTAKQWPVIVDNMQNKAKISDIQKAIILRYLLSDAKKEESDKK